MLLAGGCTRADDRTDQETLTGRLAAGEVTVEVTLVNGQVRATFRPDRAGFHLYSLDLPPAGVQGLGIPTVVAVRGRLHATGKPAADVPVRALRIDELNVELPVYPDGPVTVTLPVRATGEGPAEVVVTYGACSENTCLPPVRDQAITLN